MLSMLIAGCQSPLLTQSVVPPADFRQTKEISPSVPPFDQPPAELTELDSEIVYQYLAGAIGAQRGHLDDSFEHFIETALLAKAALPAEKAAYIALHQKKTLEALRATNLWVEYAPNSLQARQLSALLNFRDNNLDRAEQQFEALLKITSTKGLPGFERIAALLATEKESARSIVLMQRLLANHTKDPHAHYALGLMQTEKKAYPEAISALHTASSLNPGWDKPFILEAQILTSQEQTDEAALVLKSGIKNQPGNSALHIAYGRLLTQQEKYSAAIKQFQKSLDLEPDNLDILYAVGMIAMQIEDWKTARKALDKLEASDSKERKNEARYFLGQIEEQQGHNQKAMRLYASVEDSKIHTDARIKLAQLKAHSDQLAEARAIFQQLRMLDYHRSVQIYLIEIQLLRELNHPDEAKSLFEDAVKASPDDQDLRYNRGLFAADTGDIAQAELDFKSILEKNPDHADTLNALGYTLADQTDRFEEAFVYIHKALKLKPGNPAILDSMGWVHYRLGDYKKALSYLRQAIAANPDAEISAHLGEVLWTTGNQTEAQKIWREALKDTPDSAKLKEVMQRLK